MKQTALLLFSLIALSTYAQDSIQVRYEQKFDRESEIINDLNGIQLTSIVIDDNRAHDKKILMYSETYEMGEVVKTDSVLICQTVEYKINDSVTYVVDLCDRLTFKPEMEEFKIYIASKSTGDSIETIVNYPSMSSHETLEGAKNFLFRPIQKTSDHQSFYITTNTWTPVLVLTPPMKIAQGAGSYCLIDVDTPALFYTKHGIERYYVYYLKVAQ